MRVAVTITSIMSVLLLQGCGLKTTFGGGMASEDNRSSSGGAPPPIVRKGFLWTEEATSVEYDAGLEWANRGGDWVDANGDEQGSAPFAMVSLVDDSVEKIVEVDVTAYVASFGSDFRFNQSGGTSYEFHSRESSDPAKRPILVVERGARVTYHSASADTTINRSLTTSRGAFPTLSTADGFLIRFDVALDASVTRVLVRLHSTTLQYGDQILELYRP